MATEQTQKMITVTAKAAEKIKEFMKEEAENLLNTLEYMFKVEVVLDLSYGMGFEKAPEEDDHCHGRKWCKTSS